MRQTELKKLKTYLSKFFMLFVNSFTEIERNTIRDGIDIVSKKIDERQLEVK